MPVQFQDLSSEHIKACFLKAYQAYPELHGHRIIVRQRSMSKTTMNAQPLLNWRFFRRSRRQYIVNLTDNMHVEDRISIHELPEEVLVGWFAHELGHVCDYLHRGVLRMLQFGVGYLLLPNYRAGAERIADIFAVEHGFADAIIATKQYILKHSGLPSAYKRRIELYYMSPDEVAMIAQGEPANALTIDQII
ncbi:MAG: hypothetical protein RIC19_15050 [Phaeodactylibacter sp.]|uniref:hypothetical protein n=1 Tax=Phaeodactylibacter sp. TaxID=1940289 RepID=UPI0032EC6170